MGDPYDPESLDTTGRGQNSRPQIEHALTLSDDELSDLVTLATQAKRWDLARALSAQLEALAREEAPTASEAETGIFDVTQFRRRKGDAE